MSLTFGYHIYYVNTLHNSLSQIPKSTRSKSRAKASADCYNIIYWVPVSVAHRLEIAYTSFNCQCISESYTSNNLIYILIVLTLKQFKKHYCDKMNHINNASVSFFTFKLDQILINSKQFFFLLFLRSHMAGCLVVYEWYKKRKGTVDPRPFISGLLLMCVVKA